MSVHTSRFLGKKKLADATELFLFEKPKGFMHRPGQCVDVALTSPLFGEAGSATQTFSLACGQSEPSLAIAVRMRQSPFKRVLGGLLEGSPISIDGPYGSFTLHVDKDRPAVFLAGGIGITPFISMLRTVFESGEKRQISLIYSNKTPQAAAFLDELAGYAKAHKNFAFQSIFTEGGGSFPKRRIDKKFLQKELGGMSRAVFYIAGALRFVVGMQEMLEEVGVSPDDIRTDEFPGY